MEAKCLKDGMGFVVQMPPDSYFLDVENGAEWISGLSTCIWLMSKSAKAFHGLHMHICN